jgi:hemerythrin
MELFHWDNSYSVGDPLIDGHHKTLVGLLNAVYDVAISERETAAIGEIMHQLVEYTEYHFSAEERLFAESGASPRILDVHGRMHDRLRARVREYDTLKDKNDPAVVIDFLGFMVNWFQVHIQGMDREHAMMIREGNHRNGGPEG